MVMVNHATREMTMKIVYYGPGLCGKTTNLEYIYQTATPEKKGKLLTVATETDRTLFFDFLPMELGTVKGMKLRVQLYTVPGQVFYDATRRIVLRGSDGLVFVADSQKLMMDANIESLENLVTNLKLNNLDPETVPLVLQYNKRDLPGASDPAEMDKVLNWRNVPSFTAVAIKGTGVNETLKKIIELVIRKIHEQDATLKPGKPAEKKAEEPATPPAAPPPKKETPKPPPAEPEPVKTEAREEEQIEMEVVEEEPATERTAIGGDPPVPEPVPEQEEDAEISGSGSFELAETPEASGGAGLAELEELVETAAQLQEKLLSVLDEVDRLKARIIQIKDNR